MVVEKLNRELRTLVCEKMDQLKDVMHLDAG
jgi:hypothetical protein